MTRPIVVMGPSGAGKTTVGRAIAAASGVPFQEGDDLHPAGSIAKMARGEPLTDADRRPWLAAIGDWLAAHPGGVASCSALKRAYRDALRQRAPELFVVALTADPAVLRARIAGRAGHFMPASLLVSQLALLEPLGAAEAGVTLDATDPLGALVAAARRAVA